MGNKNNRWKGGNFITRRLNGTTFSCLVQPSRTKTGEKIIFASGKVTGF